MRQDDCRAAADPSGAVDHHLALPAPRVNELAEGGDLLAEGWVGVFHPEPQVLEIPLEGAGQFLRAVDDVGDAPPPQVVTVAGVAAVAEEQIRQNLPHNHSPSASPNAKDPLPGWLQRLQTTDCK